MTSEAHVAAPSLNPLTSLFILFYLYCTLANVSSVHRIHQDTSGWILWSRTSPLGQLGHSEFCYLSERTDMDPSSQSIGRTGLRCRGAENPEDWPAVNTRGVASLCTSGPGPGVAWWSPEMLSLQTLACGCFWNLSSSTSTGQMATVHFQRPEGGSVRTTFCLTVGTHVRPEIPATYPQHLLGKHCPDRQFCVT